MDAKRGLSELRRKLEAAFKSNDREKINRVEDEIDAFLTKIGRPSKVNLKK